MTARTTTAARAVDRPRAGSGATVALSPTYPYTVLKAKSLSRWACAMAFPLRSVIAVPVPTASVRGPSVVYAEISSK